MLNQPPHQQDRCALNNKPIGLTHIRLDDDIKKAKELNNNNIEGIIVGKAIYDGDIQLEELVKEINA